MGRISLKRHLIFMRGLPSLFFVCAVASICAIATGGMIGCDSGGGGGGGSDSGALGLSVDPSRISPDSLAFLEVRFHASDFDDLDTRGLTIKLLLPDQLAFIAGSASLTTENGAQPVTPLYYGAAPASAVEDALLAAGVSSPLTSLLATDFSFLVFSLPSSVIDERTDGVLRLNLNVSSVPQVAKVFADLDRGSIDSFLPDHADFDAESTLTIDVQKSDDSNEGSGQ